MRALSYLLFTQLKNRILAIKKKPAMLVLYLFILLMIFFSAFSMLIFRQEAPKLSYADERIIYLAITGFGLLYLFIYITTGLSTGSTLFSMADVGLLFVAPVSSKKILMYGLISTMGKAMLAAFFILYQVGNLKLQFGYGMKEILALFLIYAVLVLFGQLVSIGIYIFSNGNQFRKNLVRMVLYASFGALLLTVYLVFRSQWVSLLEAVFRTVDSKWFGFVPVAGWATMFFKGVADGILAYTLISLAFFVGLTFVILALLTVGKADYYEDVLLSTETTFNMVRDAKEGRTLQRKRNKKIKIREEDEGILKGSGAFAITFKQLLEMKRSSRFIFIDGYTVLVAAAAGIAGYYISNTQFAYWVLATIIYLQFFLTLFGRLKLELIKPYIYMIPEKSIIKVFAASLTSLLKPCVDAVIIFTVFAAVGGADPLTCIFSALAYAASGAVFVSLTVVYQRVLGGQPNRLVQMMLGMTLLLMVMAPSIVSSVIAAFLLPASLDFLCTLPYTIFCCLFAFLMFFACGNLVEKAEYTGKI